MPKTAAEAKEPKGPRLCPTCEGPLTYSKKLRKWICEQCLYGAYLTDQAQREAVKRYRESEKGRASEKKYEQSEKGKTARERYLKSEKYKQRRREYNQRLKESLAIARAAMPERAKALTPAEVVVTDEHAALIQDIREYMDSYGRLPAPDAIKASAFDDYELKLSDDQVRELIQRAQKH